MASHPADPPEVFDDRKPAAQYVRMSTEHQRYSTRNQEAAIRSYADQHGFSIVRTYADKGKSGLSISGRYGLQHLISDVIEERAEYETILVYDVSRWGRFQDADESAHYEFMCKQAGVTVRYCAEQFENDDSPMATIVKSIKRAMAGEYSRELSAKVFAGHCRLVKLGFHRGSTPGLGLRRMVVDEDGNKRAVLEHGERKAILTDRTVLVPGPPHETGLVKRVYRLFVRDGRSSTNIADQLNWEGFRTQRGNLWSQNAIDRILTNEKYIGNIVYNRRSAKLRGRAVRNAQADWVRVDGVIEPILSKKLFLAAQRIVQDRGKMPSDEELLADLKALYKRHEYLSRALINEQSNLSCSDFYRKRFGSMDRAYELVGFIRKRGRTPKAEVRRRRLS
jgi:DNA invertase Pin-like site-specific DNA recombinase